mgnify:CR=1 FL=1
MLNASIQPAMRIRRRYHLLPVLSLFLILWITPASGNSHYHHLWAAAFNNPWGISDNNKGSRGTDVKGNGGNAVGPRNSQPSEKQSCVVTNCKRREEDEEKNRQREEKMALMIAGDTAVCNAADSTSFMSADSACGFF